MRIYKRRRKFCLLCGQDMHPPVYALQHFYEIKGSGNNLHRVPHTTKTVQVETKGALCYDCVYSGKFRAVVTRGYIATRNRILAIAAGIRGGNTEVDRTALFYEPLWYTPPEFWEV